MPEERTRNQQSEAGKTAAQKGQRQERAQEIMNNTSGQGQVIKMTF